MEYRLIVTLRNGKQFKHKPPATSETEWWEFIAGIQNGMQREHPTDLLTVRNPNTIYRMADVSAVQFGQGVPPEDKVPMGFRPGV